MERHIKVIPILAVDYLINERSQKANHPQTYDKFNELVDHFSEIHKNEHSNVMGRKYAMSDASTIM